MPVIYRSVGFGLLMILIAISALVAADDMASGGDKQFLAYIVSPANGARVSSPVKVVFGLASPLGVAPAGFQKDGTGHHHLIIDADLPDLTQPIPNNANYRHFGGGQTEVLLELAPGGHTLQLLLGDFAHLPHDPPIVSDQISIIVE